MDQETPSLIIPSHKGAPCQIDDHLSMIYCRDIDEVNSHLDLLDTSDVFFSYDFYKAVESHVPHGLTFRYVILYDKEELIGFMHFQIKKIDLGESLEAAYDHTTVHSWWQKLTHAVKLFFARKLNYYTLVSGNMLQTGRYGLHLQQGMSLPIESYHKVLEAVSLELKKEGISISAILMKDFYEDQRLEIEKTKALGYHEFSVQPTMLMDIPEEWRSMDDYMAAIKSKYKVRTRRTFKKCESVEKIELSEEDLLKYQDRTHEMYKNIATQASFNLFILDPKYFYSLKHHLKEKCKVIGYFCEGKMVGFYTIIYNGDVVDAHFLGYDKEFNKTMHLYHNMLYDLLEEAIISGADHLDLSRTAMAIKSSIGAVPHKMYLYLKIRNRFINLITSKALKFLVPEAAWEQRNPFK